MKKCLVSSFFGGEPACEASRLAPERLPLPDTCQTVLKSSEYIVLAVHYICRKVKRTTYNYTALCFHRKFHSHIHSLICGIGCSDPALLHISGKFLSRHGIICKVINTYYHIRIFRKFTCHSLVILSFYHSRKCYNRLLINHRNHIFER